MALPAWVPLNTELLRNPYNWVVLFLMIAIAALALHLIFAPTATSAPEETAS